MSGVKLFSSVSGKFSVVLDVFANILKVGGRGSDRLCWRIEFDLGVD